MIYLDIACNDPANGLFCGRADQLNICSEGRAQDIELECLSWRAPTIVELDDAIRLSGKVWPIERVVYGVGNWCWNRYLLVADGRSNLDVMTDFLIWLRDRRLYDMTLGHEDLCDWFNNANVRTSRYQVHAWLCDFFGDGERGKPQLAVIDGGKSPPASRVETHLKEGSNR